MILFVLAEFKDPKKITKESFLRWTHWKEISWLWSTVVDVAFGFVVDFEKAYRTSTSLLQLIQWAFHPYRSIWRSVVPLSQLWSCWVSGRGRWRRSKNIFREIREDHGQKRGKRHGRSRVRSLDVPYLKRNERKTDCFSLEKEHSYWMSKWIDYSVESNKRRSAMNWNRRECRGAYRIDGTEDRIRRDVRWRKKIYQFVNGLSERFRLLVMIRISFSQWYRMFALLNVISIKNSIGQRRILIRSTKIHFEPTNQQRREVHLNERDEALLALRRSFETNGDRCGANLMKRLLEKFECIENFISDQRMIDIQGEKHIT